MMLSFAQPTRFLTSSMFVVLLAACEVETQPNSTQTEGATPPPVQISASKEQALVTELDQTRLQLHNANEQISTLKQSLHVQTNRVSQLTAELESIQKAQIQLAAKLQEREAALATMNESQTAMDDLLAVARAELAESQVEERTLAEEIKGLRRRLARALEARP